MSSDPEAEQGTVETIQRQFGRTFATGLLIVLSLVLIGGWSYQGIYEIAPGEAAVILRLGAFHRTVAEEGLKWHWPPPLEYATKLNVSELRQLEFGQPNEATSETETGASSQSAIQTADSNIVNLRYVLQYKVDDAYSFAYGMAAARATLHDATQAAVREIVGKKGIDAVLSSERAQIESQARDTLHETLSQYFENGRSAFAIERIGLQVVQPPAEVQGAFDDVVAAQQDHDRLISEARGDRREILERAGAEAIELREGALAYKEAKILESAGEASRFVALLSEYRRSPEVTRRRLYLETMETILPDVQKVIVAPNTVNMLPLLPLPGLPGPSALGAGGTAR